MKAKTAFRVLLASGLAALLGLSACTEPEVEETLQFDFQDDLSKYDSVHVLILDPADTGKVLEIAFHGKLEPGQKLPRYALKESDGKEFIIRVVGFDDDLAAYRNDIARSGDGFTAKLAPDSVLPGAPPALSGIQLSTGSLEPAFHKDSLVYRVSVAYEESVFVLTPTFPGTMAGVTVDGDPAASGKAIEPIDLRLGKTSIEAKVVTQNGKVKIYTVVIERARGKLSTLSGLSLLTVSAGSLYPPFHKDSLDYRVFMPEGSIMVALSALAEDDSASVSIPPQEASKGSAQGNLALRVGTNFVTVKVVAEDTAASRTYRLSVTVPPNSLGGF